MPHRKQHKNKFFWYALGRANFFHAAQKIWHMPATAKNLSRWQDILSIADLSYRMI
jgi:hypothetical protein